MTSGVCNKRYTLSRKSKQLAISGAGKPWSRVHLTSNKGQHPIPCSYTNTQTERNMERGEEVIILIKEGTIDMAQSQKSNYWIYMREVKFAKRQQQGLVITNPDIVNPAKPFIPYKYKNQMELNKLKS